MCNASEDSWYDVIWRVVTLNLTISQLLWYAITNCKYLNVFHHPHHISQFFTHKTQWRHFWGGTTWTRSKGTPVYTLISNLLTCSGLLPHTKPVCWQLWAILLALICTQIISIFMQPTCISKKNLAMNPAKFQLALSNCSDTSTMLWLVM